MPRKGATEPEEEDFSVNPLAAPSGGDSATRRDRDVFDEDGIDANGKGVGTLYQMTQAVRPHITKLQLFQFVTMMSQAAYILYYRCGSPLVWTKIYFFYILSMFALFMRFFYTAYMNKNNRSKKTGKQATAPTRKSKRIAEQSRRSAAAERDTKKDM